MNGEEHQTKVQNYKEDTEGKPFWIEAMLNVMDSMLGEYWEILKKAAFESPIVIAVNSNVQDSTKVDKTENGVEKNLPWS